MKLQVTQENLNRALSAVSRIASSRGTLPILANVALKTTGNRLSVAATNLDIAVSCFVGAKISQEGATTVPARLLADFVASLPAGVIDLKLEDNKLKVSTGGYHSTVNSVNIDDFPTMPEIKNGKKFSLEAADFRPAVSRVVGAASNDETRPVLTGVYLAGGDQLTVAATDSYRLAEKKLSKTAKFEPLVVPANAMAELLRVLPDGDNTLSVNYNQQQISFSTDDIELTARLIDGTYPPYQNLIPSKFTTTAELSHSDFTNVVKVSSLFARESAGSITINIDDEQQKLSVHSIASQLGENTADAEAKTTGSGSITLNSRYVLDALSAMVGGGNVTIGFNGKLEPVVLKQKNDPSFVYVVMPLKS